MQAVQAVRVLPSDRNTGDRRDATGWEAVPLEVRPAVASEHRAPVPSHLVDTIRDRGTAVPAPPEPRLELPPEDPAVKRTFQPNSRRRARKHGFRSRMRTRAGRAIVKARRLKGRRKLTA